MMMIAMMNTLGTLWIPAMINLFFKVISPLMICPAEILLMIGILSAG
jgi:hypothetical protein